MGHRKVGIDGVSYITIAAVLILGVLVIAFEGTTAANILLVLQMSIAGTYVLAMVILGWKRRQKDWKP